jgi:hypothetical protein
LCFSGTDVFVLMQGSRGFSSQVAKSSGKQIKVLAFPLMRECS